MYGKWQNPKPQTDLFKSLCVVKAEFRCLQLDISVAGWEEVEEQVKSVCFFPSEWFRRISKSRLLSPAQSEHAAKGMRNNGVSASSFTPTTASTSLATSPPGAPPSPSSQSSLSSALRRSRRYDVFVCHSSVGSDCQEALKLVAYLEASPQGLRCFLQHRDDCPGGAMSTELSQAVENSHLWALLITPDFLQDDWCRYMMHQALAEGPMSNRIIPLYKNLSKADYPQELRFFYSINLNQNPERGYSRLNMTLDTCEYDLFASSFATRSLCSCRQIFYYVFIFFFLSFPPPQTCQNWPKNTKTHNCNTDQSGREPSMKVE